MHNLVRKIRKVVAGLLAIAIVTISLPVAQMSTVAAEDDVGMLRTNAVLDCLVGESQVVSLYDGDCPFTPDDIWMVEADITVNNVLEGASVGLRLGAESEVFGFFGEQLKAGTSWHFKYTINADGSIQTVITSDENTIVDKVDRGYEFQAFEPQWYAKSGRYTVSNVQVESVLDDVKDTLDDAISEYAAIDTSIYTEESKSTFVEALESAESIRDDSDSTRTEITKATVALHNAAEALEVLTTEVLVGGGNTNTTAVTYDAVAGEELLVGEWKGKYITGWTADGKKVTTYNNENQDSLSATFVDTKMLDVKYQESDITSGKRNIRFIASVNTLQYSAVGFMFSTKNINPSFEDETCLKTESTVVYETLLADGKSTDIAGAGYDSYSEYMYAYEINNVPVDETSPVHVRAYVRLLNGDIVYGTARTVIATASSEKKYCLNKIEELFHDQGYIYMTPDEPVSGDTVTLRLRTLRYNLNSAQIMYSADEGTTWQYVDMTLERYDDTGYYGIWKGEFEVPAAEKIYYRFVAKNTIYTRYYDRLGITTSASTLARCWQFIPDFDSPEWAKGALYYSVLPDAFYNGNTLNDKQISGDNTYVTWNQVRKDLLDKYGGDLAGIASKLDYMESLGIDAVYMNPINKSYQNAGYGTIRYDEVESSFGNEKDLAQLSEKVHARGLKMVGDVVLTFTPQQSYYFNQAERWPVTGAYQSVDSAWYNLFQYDEIEGWPTPQILWGGAKINFGSKISESLLYKAADSYLLKYADLFDGYRFDSTGNISGELTHDEIVKDIRDSLRAVDDDFYLLAEWDNNADIWDSRWNLEYNSILANYALGTADEDKMMTAMLGYLDMYPRNMSLCFVNMLSNHDEDRVNQPEDYMYNAAVLLQMTYLGSPSIYYGEEIECLRVKEENVGNSNSFYAMEWDESNWNQKRLNFYKATGELRQEFSCVKTGAVNVLDVDAAQNLMVLGRWDENGAVITVASQNSNTVTVEISAKNCDIKNGTVMTDWYTGAKYKVENGLVTVNVAPGGTVLVTGEKSTTLTAVTYEDSVNFADGEFTLDDNVMLTNGMEDDWTFKAELGSVSECYLTEGQYAGVVCRQDEKNYIVAGRTYRNGKAVVFLGKYANGKMAVYGSVEDPVPELEVIVQLQRTGAYYSAVYSSDGGSTWHEIGKVYSNFCKERVGILAMGCSVVFDDVSFGDGTSTNTPHAEGVINVKYTNNSTAEEAKYEILSGDWNMVTGGWRQAKSSGFAQMAVTNKEFVGLYTEATIDINSGDGWAGFGFGKTTADCNAEDGYYLKLYDTGLLVLAKGTEILAKRRLAVSGEEAVRLVLQAFEGAIYVYAGQEAAPVITLEDTGYASGYVSFCSDGVSADFLNFHHGSTEASWKWISGSGGGNGNSLYTTVGTSDSSTHTIATLTGYSFTDFVCTGRLTLAEVTSGEECASGFLLCASEGKSHLSDGVYVYMDGEGNLKLSVNGEVKSEYALPEGTDAPLIMIVKQNQIYKVYLSTKTAPVLTYSEQVNRGGMLSVYTINGKGTFTNLAVEGLQPGQNYMSTKIAGSWKEKKSFCDNYDSKLSIDNYLLVNQNYGKYTIHTDEGVLQCSNSTGYEAGATVTSDIYSDFTMEFKLRFDNLEGSFVAIGMRKNIPNTHYNVSGLSLMVSRDGTVHFFRSGDKDFVENLDKNLKAGKTDAFVAGEWRNVKIVVKGQTYEAYVDGELMQSYTDTSASFTEGYINFISGGTNFSVDNLSIIPKVQIGEAENDGFGPIS